MNKAVTKERDYWDNFYTRWDIDIPSQFCVLVATEAEKERPFVEFGCGNGRDSIYLARHGFRVFSGDLSAEAIDHNIQKEGGPHQNPRVTFHVCDVANPQDVKSLINEARGTGGALLTLYNRFFLHSIDDDQERLFLTALSEATKTGDRLYMEFRCSLDADLDKVHGDHYRRYVETSKLITLLKELGFDVSYEITGQGMAKYQKEDPFVSRLIVDRK
jgi:SAM-dependent methyltransferase